MLPMPRSRESLSIPQAILDQNNKTIVETTTDPGGNFELSFPPGGMSLVVLVYGFEPFRKDLDTVKEGTTALEVRLSTGCPEKIPQVIPEDFDLRNFLVEIHYWGDFGGCPEKIYRLWGTGEASVAYVDCDGKTHRASRVVDSSTLRTTITTLAKSSSAPICNNYPGGLDAPRVGFLIYSGSEPRIDISHDAGENIESLTSVEERLEKLIDPDDRMHSFKQQSTQSKK